MKINCSLRQKVVLWKFPMLVVLGLLAILANPAFAGGPPPRELTWGNDQQYIMLTPKEPVPASNSAQEELYVIGAIDPNNPQSPGHLPLIGPHDHVIPIPPHNGGTYSAIWHAFAIVPGPNASVGNNVLARFVAPPSVPLIYAADLNGDGTVQLPEEQLTSAIKIEKAGDLGLVAEVDTGVVFVCPIMKVGKPT